MPVLRPDGLPIPPLNFGMTAEHHPSPQLSFSTGKLKFPDDDREYDFTADDLEEMEMIGRGNFGTVHRMVHRITQKVMAVKRIRSTAVNSKDRKNLLMELETVINAAPCENIVRFYGALFYEGDCWICMELMDISLDKLYTAAFKKDGSFPEEMIGFIAVSTINALNYLKEELSIIHRDVKPSNILLDRQGQIKLCDFGIAGRLVDSIAQTQEIGCRPYMAPERVSQLQEKYDVRSDVWSLGISLYEISTGRFPYEGWNTPFDQVAQVVHGDPPMLTTDSNHQFSLQHVTFVNKCLAKGKLQRPKYAELKTLPFFKQYDVHGEELEMAKLKIGVFVSYILDSCPN